MKKYLEYTSEKSSKFWKIEVDEKTHIISYGKIGTNGQTNTKEFTTVEAAIKEGEKLVKAKLKKGYLILNQEEDSQKKWFERLNHKIFTIYKAAILKYPIKEYKYIQLNWTGQGFALGLSPNPRDGYHEYIDNGDWHNEDETSLESVYRQLENIPYEKYDEEDDCEYEVDFEREEWPKDSSDCFELECFLINVGLGLTYIRLEKDKEVKKYLDKIEVIKIISSDRVLGSFTYNSPDKDTQKNVVQDLLKNDKERELILDLWGKEAKKTGLKFLKHFQREVTKIKDIPAITLKEAHEQASDLRDRYRNEDVIEVLQPVLERVLNNSETKNPELIEKCCNIMGEASIDNRNGCKESIYWFQKGIEFVPNGRCAISLMSLYELDIDDDIALVAFCENHLQRINLEDNVNHTFECYRHLGRGYLSLNNKEKAVSTYQIILDFLTRMNKTSLIEYAAKDLRKIEDWFDEYKIAIEILTWFKIPEIEVD